MNDPFCTSKNRNKVIRKKGETQYRCFKKTKHSKFSVRIRG